MITDIEIEISLKKFQKLLINLEPAERFASKELLLSGVQNICIYPNGDMDKPKIILKVKE